ncbi:amino acid ABC transporter permease [Tepidibacillus marianensis]|uniref:amino acid ABC transporter permease n=1 Tax=Tepidibacillus marianensis TaxID=3131995 RepID=UPI0030CCAB46
MFQFQAMIDAFHVLLIGLWMTLQMAVYALIIANIIGLITALMKLARLKWMNFLANTYINLIRGTPLLVQVFFIYFAMPAITGTKIEAWVAGLVALSLNAGAYISEIFRSGIQAVPKGQMEAARSLGMTHGQAMRYIILPQAFKIVIPPLLNQFIITLKDTSIISVIGFEELTRKGQMQIATTYRALEIWTEVAIFYFVLIFSLTLFTNWIERKVNQDFK